MLVEVRIADIDPPIPCIITPYSTNTIKCLVGVRRELCPEKTETQYKVKYSKYPKYNGHTITDSSKEINISQIKEGLAVLCLGSKG